MVMLRKRKILLSMIDMLPRITGRKSSKSSTFISEVAYCYKQLGIYDNIIDSINLGKVGLI